MKQKRISVLVMFFLCFIIPGFVGALDQGNTTYVEEVVIAKPSDYPIEKFWEAKRGVNVDNKWLYYSSTGDIVAYLKNKRKSIVVKYKEQEKTIDIKTGVEDSTINYVTWRPGYPGFVYSRSEEDDDGGDIGACSIHYVEVKKVAGNMSLIEKTLFPYSFDTDFAWSSDGKYYAYLDGVSLIIVNFETGKTWATKRIYEPGNINLYPGVAMVGLEWIDGDQKILLVYKESPGCDQMYTSEILVSQFGLE